jgi:hypothetical protein
MTVGDTRGPTDNDDGGDAADGAAGGGRGGDRGSLWGCFFTGRRAAPVTVMRENGCLVRWKEQLR